MSKVGKSEKPVKVTMKAVWLRVELVHWRSVSLQFVHDQSLLVLVGLGPQVLYEGAT